MSADPVGGREATKELLTVRPIAQGPRQRAPFAHGVKAGDLVELVYVRGGFYTDRRRGEVVRRYVSGSVEVRFTEPTRRDSDG